MAPRAGEDGWTSDDGWVDPNQYDVDNGSTDIAEIIRKHDQGFYLNPQEQQRYDTHMQEYAARTSGGGGGASNGAAGTGFYAPGGVAAKVSRVAALPIPNLEKAASGDLFGALPKDPLGTPFIDDGQSLSTTGLGGAVSGAGGFSNFGGTGSTNPAGAAGSGGPGAPGGSAVPNPSDPIQQMLEEARRNRDENNAYIDNTLTPRMNTWNGMIGDAYGGIAGTIQAQRGVDDELAGQYGGMFAQQTQNAAKYNQSDLDSLANYGGALNTANAADQNTLGFLTNQWSQTSQLSPTQIRSNLQAITAQLNTAGLTQAQYEAASMTKAALERAQSNPDDVRAQKEALGLMNQMSEGSLDIQNGGNTPEAKAAQLEALSRYGTLSASPNVTGQERYIYESARQRQEQDEKARIGAILTSSRMKGQGGANQELAAILQGGQNNSQNRLLSDLGAESNAVDRQMQALAGYGQLSSGMMQQGNDVAGRNASNRLQATGMRGNLASTIRGQGDTMNMFNTGQANQMSAFNAGQANQNAQFNAGQLNANRMGNAQMANAREQFNAGQANMVGLQNASFQNQTQQYNQTQNTIQSQFEDNYRATQQDSAWNRTADLSGASFGVNAAAATRAGALNTATNATNAADYGRDKDTVDLWGQGATNIYNAKTGTNNTQVGALGNWAGQLGAAAGRDLAVSGQRIGTSQTGSQAVQTALGGAAGDAAAQAAINSVQNPPKKDGNPLSWVFV
jgi:hypothetical protein